MAVSLRTLLMFQGAAAADAIDFYLSIFEDASVEQLVRYGPGETGAEGLVKHARIRIGDSEIAVIDSPVEHAFGFTPSTSLVVEEPDPDRLRRTWERLAEGGSVLMPLDRYSFSDCFGWVTDRFGVSWQIMSAWPG